MGKLDLRPLSVGEILDRTFTLYRGNFILFAGISAIPHILTLALSLAQVMFVIPAAGLSASGSSSTVPLWLQSGSAFIAFASVAMLGVVAMIVAFLLSQGATVVVISELYLGRMTSMSEAFRRVFSRLGMLFGLLVLNILAIFAGLMFLVIPGVYLMCRLLVSLPAMLVENLAPTQSMSRSYTLTQDNAGRAFLLILLYYTLSVAATMLFAVPFEILMFLSAKNPHLMLIWAAVTQVGAFIAGVLVMPVLTIGSAILYFDLRVRKEAFDLQVMMNPLDAIAPAPAAGSLPRMLN